MTYCFGSGLKTWRETGIWILSRLQGFDSADMSSAVTLPAGRGRWLRESGRKLIVEYAPAPRGMGGSGAFVVF